MGLWGRVEGGETSALPRWREFELEPLIARAIGLRRARLAYRFGLGSRGRCRRRECGAHLLGKIAQALELAGIGSGCPARAAPGRWPVQPAGGLRLVR